MKKRDKFAIAAVLALGLLTSCSSFSNDVPIASSLTNVLTEELGKPIKDGSFTTEYNSKIKNRTHNLELAVKSLDGATIRPGEVLSFNETLGPITKEAGYKPAKIFVKGKELEGIGGGVCQVSSTLYNAADYAGLEIVERHAHSRRVYYVEKGRDAATSYGGVDLKVKNTLPHPIKVQATAKDGKLTVSLLEGF